MFVLGLGESGLFPGGFVESLRGLEREEDGGLQVSDLCLKEFKAIVGRHSLFFRYAKILPDHTYRHLWARGQG
jgi:hypothetical protein